MVQGEPWGLHGFFSTFRLACSNLRQQNEEVVVVVILMAFLANLYPLHQLLYGYPILLYGVMLSIACACLLKWEEIGVPGGNPRKHEENMQTPPRGNPHKLHRRGNPGQTRCEATALTTAPPRGNATWRGLHPVVVVVVVVILMPFLANLYPLRQLLYGYPILQTRGYEHSKLHPEETHTNWEEIGVPGGNPHKHGENIQTPPRGRPGLGRKRTPGPSCCEATAQTHCARGHATQTRCCCCCCYFNGISGKLVPFTPEAIWLPYFTIRCYA